MLNGSFPPMRGMSTRTGWRLPMKQIQVISYYYFDRWLYALVCFTFWYFKTGQVETAPYNNYYEKFSHSSELRIYDINHHIHLEYFLTW